ncbi:exo-alpha-sialidase [Anatilimnocola sp. NA78]|uniref:exo-alpha-sialidase n=1 Tax=Anatilimnocola sp. NA78 TaxID=3415683 RepID=UPI003CE4B0C4
MPSLSRIASAGLFVAGLLISAGAIPSGAQETKPATVLDLPGSGTDEKAIDYSKLPLLKGQHAVICATTPEWKFQLHNYLLHHEGKFWCMWSHGPEVEDLPTQHISFATSEDGLKWSEPKSITGPPPEGYAYIARGLWVREGALLALAAFYKGKGAFGVNKELKLQAYAWDGKSAAWKLKGIVADNAINNFPPQRLSSGQWMTTKRDSRFNVSMLIGGQKSFDDWQAFPVVERTKIKGFSPDEPIWWEVGGNKSDANAEKKLVALFRDNGGSGRLFQAFSTDQGRMWSLPVITNFPNSTSKIFSLQLSTGQRVLISNANPGIGRRELHLSLSDDGLTFRRMARLDIPSAKPATLQYPHAIEHEGHLLIAFSRNKVQSEILKVSLAEIAALSTSK